MHKNDAICAEINEALREIIKGDLPPIGLGAAVTPAMVRYQLIIFSLNAE